jgi:hypothetical protein
LEEQPRAAGDLKHAADENELSVKRQVLGHDPDVRCGDHEMEHSAGDEEEREDTPGQPEPLDQWTRSMRSTEIIFPDGRSIP